MLIPGTQAGFRWHIDTFRRELERLGHVEASDVTIDVRYANDNTERLVVLAAELAATNPAVILTLSSAGIAACMKATSVIPIVFTSGGSPVERGFVKSLRRPGGNVTGVLTNPEIVSKLVELAREALPNAQRIALLTHEPDPAHRQIVEQFVAAAEKFRFQPLVTLVAGVGDLERAFSDMAARKADALIPANLVFSVSRIDEIVQRSLRGKLALITSYVHGSATDAVLSYGTMREENWQRGAALVDKILRGANPAELPVEQPSRFQLVANLKTAKTIGVTLPQGLVVRADRVIE